MYQSPTSESDNDTFSMHVQVPTSNDEKDAILFESCYITKREIEWKNATENGKTEGLDMKALKTES